MAQYVYRANQVRKLKEGVDLRDYLDRHPGAYAICKPPSEATLQRWDSEGYCEALDGCHVEPDGDCPHGKPSWLKALLWI